MLEIMLNQVDIYQGIVRISEDSVLDIYNESIKRYNKRVRQYLGKFYKIYCELIDSNPLVIIQLINSGALPEE